MLILFSNYKLYIISSNELKAIANVQSANFQLVAGTGFLAVVVPSFYLGVSKILGLTCATPVGVGADTAVVSSIAVANPGAVGSHASIVSRELGIPCVASVADATKKIPDGANITVNGSTGTITINSL